MGDFTEADLKAQKKLMRFIGRTNLQDVSVALHENPVAVALMGKRLPYEEAQSKVEAIEALFREGRRTEADVERANQIVQLVRDATWKYAIDNEDIELLARLEKAGDSLVIRFADGTRIRDYVETQGKHKVQAWIDEEDAKVDARLASAFSSTGFFGLNRQAASLEAAREAHCAAACREYLTEMDAAVTTAMSASAHL